ncbi:hypothetical protein MTBUT4_850003 [Magnetospirillum sp. UT-4]|nr:hypothetical protein MTBUT4_850003 [Magnetospirillum sp. UT-4]
MAGVVSGDCAMDFADLLSECGEKFCSLSEVISICRLYGVYFC